MGARKRSQGLRSVHSSRCAHKRLSLAGRIPPPGHARCFQAPAEDAALEGARALGLSTT